MKAEVRRLSGLTNKVTHTSTSSAKERWLKLAQRTEAERFRLVSFSRICSLIHRFLWKDHHIPVISIGSDDAGMSKSSTLNELNTLGCNFCFWPRWSHRNWICLLCKQLENWAKYLKHWFFRSQVVIPGRRETDELSLMGLPLTA